MDKQIVRLTGEKELRIFMHPLRQKMLRTMRLMGKPVTAKQLADTLVITPSSAKHHLSQLEGLGIVGIHHTEIIHGITATYYSLLPVTVSIGLDSGELADDRMAVAQNLLVSAFDGFRKSCAAYSVSQDGGRFAGDILTGVVNLRQEDADALYKTITRFIEEHETAGESTIPFEYALLLYDAGDQSI